MENYNIKDVRWMAFYSESTGSAKVIPYIIKEQNKIMDLLAKKVCDKKSMQKSFGLKESDVVSKDWSTEEMINNYYKALKNVSHSHATKFLEKYESLDELQIQSWVHKLEKELLKMVKEQGHTHKKELKRKLKNQQDNLEL